MSSKGITIALLGGIVVLLALYFAAKGAVFSSDSIPEMAEQVKTYVDAGKWDEAQTAGNQIKETWERHKYLVMLNYAEEDYSTLEHSINTIIGGTKGKDEASVYAHIEILKDLWENINLLVPEP